MQFSGEHLDLVSGRYRVDAKSLIGIFHWIWKNL